MNHNIVAGQLERDELRSMVAMLCARFPDSGPADVERLVNDVYRHLSDNARIRSHLIPLTLNRCRQLLCEEAGHPVGGDLAAAV